jgi:hypothetical protein
MLHQIASFEPSGSNLNDVYFLSVHALESGGTQLTKTQMFLGSRVYYSGGAVATYSLVEADGKTLCSGIAYGYRGFVKADDLAWGVQPVVGANTQTTIPGTQNALPNGQRFSSNCR